MPPMRRRLSALVISLFLVLLFYNKHIQNSNKTILASDHCQDYFWTCQVYILVDLIGPNVTPKPYMMQKEAVRFGSFLVFGAAVCMACVVVILSSSSQVQNSETSRSYYFETDL